MNPKVLARQALSQTIQKASSGPNGSAQSLHSRSELLIDHWLKYRLKPFKCHNERNNPMCVAVMWKFGKESDVVMMSLTGACWRWMETIGLLVQGGRPVLYSHISTEAQWDSPACRRRPPLMSNIHPLSCFQRPGGGPCCATLNIQGSVGDHMAMADLISKQLTEFFGYLVLLCFSPPFHFF